MDELATNSFNPKPNPPFPHTQTHPHTSRRCRRRQSSTSALRPAAMGRGRSPAVQKGFEGKQRRRTQLTMYGTERDRNEEALRMFEQRMEVLALQEAARQASAADRQARAAARQAAAAARQDPHGEAAPHAAEDPAPSTDPLGPQPLTICIIGAGGFIGSHPCEKLVAETAHVVLAVDVHCDKIRHLLGDPSLAARIAFHRVNIKSDSRLEGLIKMADLTINLAAICTPADYNTRPLDTIYSNFIDALPVVKYCSENSKRLIHFSTCEVYGKTIGSFLP